MAIHSVGGVPAITHLRVAEWSTTANSHLLGESLRSEDRDGGRPARGCRLMKEVSLLRIVVVCIGILILTPAAVRADQGAGALVSARVCAVVCFPDMSEINAFLAENRLDRLGEVLWGGGGSGRVGRIGGLAVGGSAWAFTASSANAQAQARLYAVGGGLDLSVTVGGDARSVLIAGVVVGGGVNLLRVSGYPHPTVSSEEMEIVNRPSDGLVPEPVPRDCGVVTGVGRPYVSVTAQLTPRLGLELRAGTAFRFAACEFGNLIGLSASSLKLSGPTISVGLWFGGTTPRPGTGP